MQGCLGDVLCYCLSVLRSHHAIYLAVAEKQLKLAFDEKRTLEYYNSIKA
jgi:hypothetical protein